MMNFPEWLRLPAVTGVPIENGRVLIYSFGILYLIFIVVYTG